MPGKSLAERAHERSLTDVTLIPVSRDLSTENDILAASLSRRISTSVTPCDSTSPLRDQHIGILSCTASGSPTLNTSLSRNSCSSAQASVSPMLATAYRLYVLSLTSVSDSPCVSFEYVAAAYFPSEYATMYISCTSSVSVHTELLVVASGMRKDRVTVSPVAVSEIGGSSGSIGSERHPPSAASANIEIIARVFFLGFMSRCVSFSIFRL